MSDGIYWPTSIVSRRSGSARTPMDRKDNVLCNVKSVMDDSLEPEPASSAALMDPDEEVIDTSQGDGELATSADCESVRRGTPLGKILSANSMGLKSGGVTKRGRGRGRGRPRGAKQPAHACSECPFTCARADTLQRHLQQWHRANVSFRCSLCQHTAASVELMRDHVSQQHQGRTVEFGALKKDMPPPAVGPPEVVGRLDTDGLVARNVAQQLSSAPATARLLFPHMMFSAERQQPSGPAAQPTTYAPTRRRPRRKPKAAGDEPRAPQRRTRTWKDRLVSQVRNTSLQQPDEHLTDEQIVQQARIYDDHGEDDDIVADDGELNVYE